MYTLYIVHDCILKTLIEDTVMKPTYIYIYIYIYIYCLINTYKCYNIYIL